MSTRWAEAKFQHGKIKGWVFRCMTVRGSRPVTTRTYVIEADGKSQVVNKAAYEAAEREAGL